VSRTSHHYQAGADALSEEEEDYLDINLDGELIDGVKLKLTEDVDLKGETSPDDQSTWTHSTYSDDKAHLLANQRQEGNFLDCGTTSDEERILLPQAAIDTCEDTRFVESAPDI